MERLRFAGPADRGRIKTSEPVGILTIHLGKPQLASPNYPVHFQNAEFPQNMGEALRGVIPVREEIGISCRTIALFRPKFEESGAVQLVNLTVWLHLYFFLSLPPSVCSYPT